MRDEAILSKVNPSWTRRITEGVIITLVSAIIVTTTTNLYWLNQRIEEARDREVLRQKLGLSKEISTLINNPPAQTKTPNN